MTHAHNPLLHEDVNKRLLTNILHTLMGLAAVISLNLVDTWFVSQLGVSALSVMGFVGPVALMANSALVGAEMATTVNIAKATAQHKHASTLDTSHDANNSSQSIVLGCLSFGLAISIPIAIFMMFAGRWIFTLMGASEAVIDLGIDYFRLLFLGFPFMSICIIGGGLLRGIGQPKKAARLLLLLTIINLILDPLLIFGAFNISGLGITGAAWAGLVAKITCALLFIKLLREKFALNRLFSMNIEQHFRLWQRIVKLASTVAFNRLLIPFGVVVATGLIAIYGDKVVAAFGLTSTLFILPTAFVLAINGALVPFISQNMAVELTQRTGKGIRFCLWLILVWGLSEALIFWLFKDVIIRGFSHDPQVIELMELCLTLVPISLMGVGLFLLNNALCYSLQKSRHVLLLNLTRCFVLYLPCVWFGGYFNGANGVFIGLFVANVLMGMVASVSIFIQYKSLPQIKSSQAVKP